MDNTKAATRWARRMAVPCCVVRLTVACGLWPVACGLWPVACGRSARQARRLAGIARSWCNECNGIYMACKRWWKGCAAGSAILCRTRMARPCARVEMERQHKTTGGGPSVPHSRKTRARAWGSAAQDLDGVRTLNETLTEPMATELPPLHQPLFRAARTPACLGHPPPSVPCPGFPPRASCGAPGCRAPAPACRAVLPA